MVFCVLFDPECIRSMSAQGELGQDHMLGVFRSLAENCLFAETEDWLIGPELADAVKSFPEVDAHSMDIRKKLMSLLEEFTKRGRFVPVARSILNGRDLEFAELATLNQGNENLDAIISEAPAAQMAGVVELCSIRQFNNSNFAQRRQQMADGVAIDTGEYRAADFFDRYFKKLFLEAHDTQIDLIDYLIGHDFGGNYFENLPFWVDFFNSLKTPLRLTIHTEDGNGLRPLRNEISRLCEGTQITAVVQQHRKLPHERYLLTPRFGFIIGRGLDLFDPRTQRTRDLGLTRSSEHLENLLKQAGQSTVQ